jgi:phage shock protein A
MGEGLNASSELDRMEAKIRLTESEAAAYQEIESESVDAQFRELDYDIDIESALEALKSGDEAPAGQLSAGSSAETDETDSTSTY